MTRPLELRECIAGHHGVAVVHGIDLHVGAGEIVALLGPNGAGKSTTLHTVAGLLPVLGGTVEVLGESVPKRRHAHRLARRGLAYVPENRALLQNLNVRENLELAASQRHDTSIAIEYFPQLKPLLKRKAGLLSGGEQQMVALGRAIVMKPKLLLIDEMSLGLAPVIYESLFPIVRAFASSTNCAVLLVEQHVQRALAIADRAYLIERGTIIATGSGAEMRVRTAALAHAYLGSDASIVANRGDTSVGEA